MTHLFTTLKDYIRRKDTRYRVAFPPAWEAARQASLDRKKFLHSPSAKPIFILFPSALAIHHIPANS